MNQPKCRVRPCERPAARYGYCTFHCRTEKNLSKYKKRTQRHSIKPEARFKKAIRAARERGFDWLIEFEDYKNLIKQPCHICGRDLVIRETGSGLDRLNPKIKSYRLDNVKPCCAECNILRNDRYSVSEAQVMMRALLEYQKDHPPVVYERTIGNRGRKRKHDYAAILEMFHSGLTHREIAKKIGSREYKICHFIEMAMVEAGYTDDVTISKINDTEILELRKSGWAVQKIAKQVHRSNDYVLAVLKPHGLNKRISVVPGDVEVQVSLKRPIPLGSRPRLPKHTAKIVSDLGADQIQAPHASGGILGGTTHDDTMFSLWEPERDASQVSPHAVCDD